MKNRLIDFIKTTILEGKNIELSSSDDLLTTGILDSMAVMRLIGYIEEELSVKVPPEDLIIENFMTVDSIDLYLKKQQ